MHNPTSKEKTVEVITRYCDAINRYIRTGNAVMRRQTIYDLGEWIDTHAGRFAAYARQIAAERGIAVR